MEILSHPNPVLKQRAEDVEHFGDRDLKSLVAAMARDMYEAPGIGLAATQVGRLTRVLVYDVDDGLVALCNPEIVEYSDQTEVAEEGCLSFPGIEVPVERSTAVTCEAVDIDGKPVRIEAKGLLARVLQHEIDHLDGILIIDRAAPPERKAAIRRYNELRQPVG